MVARTRFCCGSVAQLALVLVVFVASPKGAAAEMAGSEAAVAGAAASNGAAALLALVLLAGTSSQKRRMGAPHKTFSNAMSTASTIWHK